MATNEGLSVKIGGTVDELLAATAQAKKALSNLSDEVNSEAGAVDNAGKRWNQLGKYIFQQTYERKRMIQQVQQGIGTWKLEAKAIEQVANSSLPKLTRTSGLATSTLTSLNQVVQDFPYGIRGWGNNATQAATQMGYLVQQTGSFGSAIKAVGSSFMGAGGIIFGVSLLINGLQSLQEKYGSLGAAIDAILTPLSAQARLQKEVNETIAQGNKDAQAELTRLETLYRATQDVTMSLKERNKIVDILQKQYPSYFGNLTNEEVLTGKAAKSYDRLRDSIVAVALARAIDKKITEQAEKQVDLIEDENILREKRLDAVLAQTKAEDRLQKLLDQGIRTKGGVEQQDRITRSVVESKSAVDGYTKSLEKNKKAQDEINNSIDRYRQIGDQIRSKFGIAGVGIDDAAASKTGKNTKTISDVLKQLQKELKAIDEYNKLVGMSSDNLAKEKLQALNKAFEDVAKIGGPQARKELEKIRSQIDLLGASVIGDKKIKGKQIISFDKKNVLDKSTGLTTERLVARVPVDISLINVNAATDKLSSQVKTVVHDAGEAARIEALEIGIKVEKAINEALQNVSLEGITFFSDSFGAALTGEGSTIQKAMKSFVGVLGDYMQQVGKQMIVYSGVLRGIQVAISSLNPAVAAIAGAAAIVAGGALKAYASKIPSFATGGGVFQPTMAMIGDNPGREEYVIPSEVLDKLGGNDAGFIAETRISGNDLLVLVKKAGVNYGRINS